jgi:hypothetical protein
MLVHFSSISQDHCFVHCLGALISRRHLALASSSLANDGWFVSSGRTGWLPELIARVRRGGLPLNEHRSGDQQHKKDRQQYWGHEPLTKIGLVDI